MIEQLKTKMKENRYLSIEDIEQVILNFPAQLPFQSLRIAQGWLSILYKNVDRLEDKHNLKPFTLKAKYHALKNQHRFDIQEWCCFAIGSLLNLATQAGLTPTPEIFDSIFTVARLQKSNAGLLPYLYRCVAESAIASGQTSITIDYGFNAYQLYHDHENRGICAYIIATAYRTQSYQSNFDSIYDAMQWIEISADHYAQTDNKRQYSLMMYEKGIIHMRAEDYITAYQWMLKAYTEFKALDMATHYPVAKMLVGVCDVQLKRYELAEPKLLEAFDYFKRKNDKRRMLHALQNLAWNYLYWGRVDQALATCEDATRLFNSMTLHNNFDTSIKAIVDQIKAEAESALNKCTLSTHGD